MNATVINTKSKFQWASWLLTILSILLFFCGLLFFIKLTIDENSSSGVFYVVLSLVLSFITSSLSKLNLITRITYYKLEQGYKVGFIPKLIKSKEIQKSDFIRVELAQDKDNYFQIFATDTKGNKILLDRLPNLNPAKAEAARIESLLENHWAIKSPAAT
tara:strand:+ start:1605 stop:2084 length:480 start_codon:yes stop_codon:yes gene_type:complete